MPIRCVGRLRCAAACLIALCFAIAGPAQKREEVDWDGARRIAESVAQGETVTDKERQLLKHAQEVFLKSEPAGRSLAEGEIDWERAGRLRTKLGLGLKLTAEEQKFYDFSVKARTQGGARGGKESVGLTPLTELSGKYKGEGGGLYGDERNEPPPAHREAAAREAARIQPLDAKGSPDPDGKIVLVSFGMSNTHMEFTMFQELAAGDRRKSPRVILVDGAQGSRGSPWWADGERIDPRAGVSVWGVVKTRLKEAGVTPQQVQAAWILQTIPNPSQRGEFPGSARALESDLAKMLQYAKSHFPNLRLAYFSSRIYAGYATVQLSPEPYAYEDAFAVRWAIQSQIAGKPELNYDPSRGEVRAPLALWGPYLWADGRTPRKHDRLTWERADFSPKDGTHPSDSARKKVGEMLLEFFKTDASSRDWFAVKER